MSEKIWTYEITKKGQDGQDVVLRSAEDLSIQLKKQDLNLLLQYPELSVKEIVDILFQRDKTLGKVELTNRVRLALGIMEGK